MPQPFSSIPGFSSLGDLGAVLAAQNRALEQLPGTLLRLTEVLEKIVPAADDAVETVHTSRRVTTRVESLVADLEGPLRELIPAIQALTATLNHPAIAGLPATVSRVQEEVHPVLDRMAAARATATRTGDRVRRVRSAAGRGVRCVLDRTGRGGKSA